MIGIIDYVSAQERIENPIKNKWLEKIGYLLILSGLTYFISLQISN